MKKRLLRAAIAAALTVSFSVPAFANSFSDVPAKHWAYDAVTKLAKEGIVDGYGDGTFRGEKTMTRYEMAQIVAKAMNKDLNSDQKAVVDKLAKEYATELNNLNIKVEGMQDQLDNMVKFNGDARARYYSADNAGSVGDRAEYRFRLGATAKVNNDMSIHARITSGSQSVSAGNADTALDNAFLSTKIIGMDTKIGRQDYSLGQGMLAGADGTAILNGVSANYGDFTVFGGKAANSATTTDEAYGAQYSFKLGAPVTVDYLHLGDKNYYAASTSFNLLPNFKVSGEYGRNETDKAKAYTVKADIGKTGLSAAYKDIEQNALPFESAMNFKANGPVEFNDFYNLSTSGHVKGMEYAYSKEIVKNTKLDVVYQDIKDHGKNVIATASVKF